MDPIEFLKKLEGLKADPEYTKRSKVLIIGHDKNRWSGFSLKEIGASALQSGWAIALSAILLFFALGGFSLWKLFSSVNTVGIDLAGITAEAQAIDIQIQLVGITYNQPPQPPAIENKTSTVQLARPAKKAPQAPAVQDEHEAEHLGLIPPSTSTSPSIDEALDALAR